MTRPDWSDVNALTRRVWIVREGRWVLVVPLHPHRYAALIDALREAEEEVLYVLDEFNRGDTHDAEEGARKARQIIRKALEQTVTKSADLPITEERPRDVRAPGAAT